MQAAEIIDGLTLPQKYYVGFSQRDQNSAHPLGFATPYDTTKASLKRQATVDAWRDQNHTPLIMNNEPVSGFKLVQSVSRYRTDNKLLRVSDPRGFDLEISMDNVLHLLTSSAVMKGELMGTYVWARRSGYNWLLSTSSENYLSLTSKSTKNELVSMGVLSGGKTYRNVASSVLYHCAGKRWVAELSRTFISPQQQMSAKYGYYSHYYQNNETMRQRISEFKPRYMMNLTAVKKPQILYGHQSFGTNPQGEPYKIVWDVRASPMKNLVEVETHSFDVPSEQTDYYRKRFFFETKKELDDFVENCPLKMEDLVHYAWLSVYANKNKIMTDEVRITFQRMNEIILGENLENISN